MATALPVTGPSESLLGTGALTVTDRAVEVEAAIGSVSLSLPAGRWLLSSVVTSRPLTGSQPSAVSQLDTTLASPGVAVIPATTTYHANKDFEAGVGGTIKAQISVQKHDGSTWQPYAVSPLASELFGSAPNAHAQLRGANVHIFGAGQGYANTLKLLDAAVDLGMDIIRTSAPWGLMETAQNNYSNAGTTLVDQFMAACAARNLKVLLIAGTAPGWAATSGQPTVNVAWNGTNYPFISNYGAPTAWSNYAEHITALINRYGSELYGIEPLNEPNALTTSAATVAAWHQYARQGITASARPAVKLVGGTISWTDQTYLQGLLTAGMGDYVDALSVHPYPVRFSPNKAYSPRQPMPHADWNHDIASVGALANLTSLPIWVSEFGFCSHFSQLGYGSEARQGEYLEYAFKQLARIPNVDVAIMHSLEDAGRSGDGVTPSLPTEWNSFGLLRTDQTSKKASYPYVKSVLAALP